jgi:transcriptional regulator with XRE-family HTH domain
MNPVKTNIFGRRLKQLRAQHGLTQLQLAKRLGVARSTVATYEAGEREPCLDAIQRVAAAFGTSTDYLLGCCCSPVSPSASVQPSDGDCEIILRIVEEARHLSEADLHEVLLFTRFRRQQSRNPDQADA